MTLARARMGAVEGWVVTQDGETLKAGFKNDIEASRWLHKRHSYSVDHAVRHEGYDIVLVRGGKVKWSYKRDVVGREHPELGMPPRFQRFRIGALHFDVTRPHGLVTDVTVGVQGSPERFRIHIDDPRLQPVDLTITKILQDLYVSADAPDRVLDLADKIGVSGEHREFVLRMIDWAGRHEAQIREAIYTLTPGMRP